MMEILHADRRLAWLMAVACTIAISLFTVIALNTDYLHTTRESGPMEVFELVSLGVASIFFFALALISNGVPRLVGAGMAMLCSFFFLREVDFREYGPDFWAAFLDNRTFKFWWHLLAITAVGLLFAREYKLIPDAIRYAMSRDSWPIWVAAITLAIGEGIERIYVKLWHTPLLEFIEESFEWSSYAMLAFAAFWFLKNAWQRRQLQP